MSLIAWPEAQRICDIPEVREALDAFALDAREENMLSMVSAIMGHASAQGRAAGLDLPLWKIDRIDGVIRAVDENGNDIATGLGREVYSFVKAHNAAIRALSPTPSDAGKDDARDAATGVETGIRVECRECVSCGHIGINDMAIDQSACNKCGWIGDSPKEDRCPECNVQGTMSAACPECGERYTLRDETYVQAPPMGSNDIEKNALRYLWLRDQMEGEEAAGGNIEIAWSGTALIHHSKVKRWPDAVDKAIDAALSSLEVIGKGEKG